ncbi:hypothetical protein PR202_ga18540 [Eleusine coracana subsp. coracana]|uniref:Uncharacterized protein n=1 Tax=Eleusine coracana subsp. coracana TaxID=191504 RepID=A0AAV5CSW1_ELECO|nr:hypothetical protein PR202_ga18540 [Eleusine coracana subsp. coracana]
MEKAAHELKVDMDTYTMSMKIHRYPASVRALGERFTVPMAVAIGPAYYHRGHDHLKPTEKVKHAAAYHCIRDSSLGHHTVEEMYQAVFSVAEDARRLYDKDLVAGISDDEFLSIMFYDACFLLQYIRSVTTNSPKADPSLLCNFFDWKDDEIFHDIMLLENQLPWMVLETVMRFVPVNLDKFVSIVRGCLYDRKNRERKRFAMDSYRPPHLLALLRYYIVGRYKINKKPTLLQVIPSLTVGIAQLAEIGITLAANDTHDLKDMGVQKKGPLFAKLYLPPLSLDLSRPSWLINMAAHELSVNKKIEDAEDEDSAVCSYLQLLAVLVRRKEDVHELRTKRILVGVGVTDKEAFDFFSGIQGLRLGSSYARIMGQIEDYRSRRRVRTKVHAFLYRNGKTIVTVFSVMAALVGVLKALQPLITGSSS